MLSYVTVTGKQIGPNGQGVKGGIVVATLSAKFLNRGNKLLVTGPYQTETAQDGSWSLTLPANTDDDSLPADTYWTFTESVSGLNAAVSLSASAVPVDLNSLPTAGGGGGGGDVSSVFTRTGAVTAQSGDYSVGQVTGAAPLASPALTGSPTAPTQTALDDSTKVATTGYTDSAVGVETSRAEAAEALLLPLAGGTMSGAIAMGSHKITGLTNGSGAQDAAAFGQIAAALASYAPIASPTFTGITTAPEFTASGLAGATAASRYVGGTASGAPASGTFAKGDFVIDQTGAVWVCTTAGSPGTWTQVGGGGGGGGNVARAYRNASLSFSQNTWTKVPLDTISFDPNSDMDVVTNHRYNVPATGYYAVTAGVQLSTTETVLTAVYHNGAQAAFAGGTAAAAGFVGIAADVLGCTSGDYLELYAYTTDSGKSIAGGSSVLNFLAVAQQRG